MITKDWFSCRYLWIDSLCIIQDDVDDWRRESSFTGTIYAYLKLNIAATFGTNSHAGCFVSRDVETFRRCIVAAPEGSTAHVFEFMEENKIYWKRNIDDASLKRRVWVLQESLLSPRTFHFAKSPLFCSCNRKRACESFPEFLEGKQHSGGYSTLTSRDAHLKWERMVESYSRSGLSVESVWDLLIGGASSQHLHFQTRRSPGFRYLWGHSSSWLPGVI